MRQVYRMKYNIGTVHQMTRTIKLNKREGKRLSMISIICQYNLSMQNELEHQNNMAYPQLVSSPTESSLYGQR